MLKNTSLPLNTLISKYILFNCKVAILSTLEEFKHSKSTETMARRYEKRAVLCAKCVQDYMNARDESSIINSRVLRVLNNNITPTRPRIRYTYKTSAQILFM